MLSTYLIIMGIVIAFIAFVAAIGMVYKIVQGFNEYASGWEKCGMFLNLLAILTVGSALTTLFITVSGLIK